MNVLFIEDDRMNRRVVRDMLDVAGVEMMGAANAPAGLELLDANEYSVVLLDLRMPGMDGMEALSHIRARPDSKAAIPIIIVTADTAPNLREQCIEAGADDVLFKPVAMEMLFDAIGRVLAGHGDSGMIH